jgi:protein SCO1
MCILFPVLAHRSIVLEKGRRASLLVAAIVLAATAMAAAVSETQAPAPISGHFVLTATDGSNVTDATYRGKWLLVYFGYTSCPDVCPTVLNEIGTALDALGPLADKVQPLFITVDPVRDTAQSLAAYLGSFDPRIVGLSGTPEQIESAAKSYHVYYRARNLGGGEYAIDHSSFLYVMNPDGGFAELLAGDLPGHKLADELRKLVK